MSILGSRIRWQRRAVRAHLLQGMPLLLAAAMVRAQAGGSAPTPVSAADLCITEGSLTRGADGRLTVATPKMRAFARIAIADAAETQFTYLGPSAIDSPLASGVLRRQFGLKLRAADACNLVYVMWRFAPESKLVVQTKINPGQHASSECGNRGYQTVTPRHTTPLPALSADAAHVLRAQLLGRQLQVTVDGHSVWQGDLASADLAPGPVGVRSDNAKVAFRLAAGPGPTLSGALPACRADGAD
jgi:hypothetical protein